MLVWSMKARSGIGNAETTGSFQLEFISKQTQWTRSRTRRPNIWPPASNRFAAPNYALSDLAIDRRFRRVFHRMQCKLYIFEIMFFEMLLDLGKCILCAHVS